MGFNLDGYELVADRLARFWTDHPAGRVNTTIDRMVDGAIIFRAEVYRDAADAHAAATGYAEETRTDRGVNATSWVENAETSAIGRALANLNYAPKTARPSREEMTKVQRGADAEPAAAQPAPNARPAPAGAPDERGALVYELQARADRYGLTAIQRRNRLQAVYRREHLHQLTLAELHQARDRDLFGPAADDINRQESMAEGAGR